MRPPSGGRIWASQGGLSRNKVAVGESAAGSPPNDPRPEPVVVLAHLHDDSTTSRPTRHLQTIEANEYIPPIVEVGP